MTRKPPAKKAPARKPAAKRVKKAAPKKKAPAAKMTPKKPLRGRGQPTDFKPQYIEQARKLCLLGATDLEIADFFGVSARTIYRWKGSIDDFCQALKAGKAEADDRIERSLFARASGYEHDEVDIRAINGKVVQTPIRKFYPPDTTACIFWLKNRRPEAWREKVEHEHGGPGGSALTVVVRQFGDTLPVVSGPAKPGV